MLTMQTIFIAMKSWLLPPIDKMMRFSGNFLLSEVNKRETKEAIKVNNDTYCLQKKWKSSCCSRKVIFVSICNTVRNKVTETYAQHTVVRGRK